MIFLSILILIVAIALPSVNQNIRTILYVRISSIIFIYAGALAFNAFYIQSIGSGIGIYSGLFQVTVISQLLDTFIFLIGGLILISWPSYSSKINVIDRLPNVREYSLIVLFSSLGASLLVSSADLISMYLSIELQSFGVYILSTLYRDSESATSAGLKYFLLGSLSSCFILLGSGIVYTYSGLTQLESIYNLISVSENIQILQGITFGIVLIIVGYLFKISAAPLHNWAPDVYDDSPTIVTIWLTIMPKISILIFLLEIQSQIGNSLLTIFSLSLKNLLLISSLLSLLIGTIVGLSQSKIKRLLAYSTISHIGFILLALAINTEQSIDSFLFYIVQYSLTNLNTFLILIALGYVLKNNSQTILESFQDIKYINELKGLFFNHPILSLSLTICLFSMAGVPPLLGFFSKQFVLYSAMQSEYYFIGIIAILVSVISASYYLKIIKVLHSENKEVIEDSNDNSPLSSLHSFMISTLTLFIIFFILKPSILLNSTQLLALSLFYY
ncbi:NADH dehydrogenase subunit 2 [Trametes coccinea BRFM310]|uniref:NADH-ubiquinone oxidoreductase chain 2 n=2 Tax=Trametes coccinea TaxID=158605 RepID=A0A1Y2I6W1_TRAC3|nr:NADH dehydrogenase subunit 2 [Trametes coccinea]OSC96162.1 NADH dehydrogenase subunit 2 [Trametes coccinea BRFM310]QPF23652.1 NADH dehydrogenase subunit 2 [Trametes coccinea]